MNKNPINWSRKQISFRIATQTFYAQFLLFFLLLYLLTTDVVIKLVLAVKCDITKTSEENANLCPKDSSCIEFGATGSCVCRNQTQKINENYTKEDKNSSYCIARNDTPSPTTITHAPVISSTQAPSIQSTASVQPPPSPTSATNKKAPVPTTTAASSFNSTTKAQVVSTEKITIAPKAVEATTNAAKLSNDTSKHKDTSANDDNSGSTKGHFMSGFGLPLLIVVAFICTVFAIRKYDLFERAHNYIRNRGTQQPQTRYDGLENDFDDDPLLI
jgi:hypothetical protein